MRKRLLGATLLLLFTTAPAPAEVKKSTNFLVDAPDAAAATRILHDAEHHRRDFARKWLGRDLGDWSVPVPIVVRLTDAEPANGHQAGVAGSRRIIYLELIGKDTFEAEESLRHEVGHAVISREVDDDAPRWLHEGVCVADELLHGDYPRRLREQIGRTHLEQFFPLQILPFYFDGDAFYGQAASLVYFIRERWGTEGLWHFYRAGRKDGWEAAAGEALRMPLGLLEREWTAWTYSLDSPYPRTLRGATPPP
jgi:hypothetical protein